MRGPARPDRRRFVDGYLDVLGRDASHRRRPNASWVRRCCHASTNACGGRCCSSGSPCATPPTRTARSSGCWTSPLATRVLDVACGPGNTTRSAGRRGRRRRLGGRGRTVRRRCSRRPYERRPKDGPLGYVRADAADLPFGDATFDVVSCYGALYLMDDPFGSLREMIRVLKPGGRIAVLTTCARGPARVRRASVVASRRAPLRLFDVHEITWRSARRGWSTSNARSPRRRRPSAPARPANAHAVEREAT